MSNEQVTELKNADLYEVSVVPAGMNLEEGFLIKKSMEGDENMAEETEEKELKFEELDDEVKEEFLNKIKEDLDEEEIAEIFLDDDEEITQKSEEPDEDDETEKAMSPKATEALKTALDKLSKVSEEIPANYQWIYKSIAELVDTNAPDFAKEAEVNELELSDATKEAIEESIKEFEEADELSPTEKSIKGALEGLIMEEEEDIKEKVSKEVEPIVKEMENKVQELKKENKGLRQKELKKELTEKANQFDNLPTSDEELTELFAELYKANETLFEEVENLLKKIDKQSEVGELFKEKGTQMRDIGSEPKTADEKLDKAVEEIIEKEDEDIDQAEAMTKLLDKRPELYQEYLSEKND